MNGGQAFNSSWTKLGREPSQSASFRKLAWGVLAISAASVCSPTTGTELPFVFGAAEGHRCEYSKSGCGKTLGLSCTAESYSTRSNESADSSGSYESTSGASTTYPALFSGRLCTSRECPAASDPSDAAEHRRNGRDLLSRLRNRSFQKRSEHRLHSLAVTIDLGIGRRPRHSGQNRGCR